MPNARVKVEQKRSVAISIENGLMVSSKSQFTIRSLESEDPDQASEVSFLIEGERKSTASIKSESEDESESP